MRNILSIVFVFLLLIVGNIDVFSQVERSFYLWNTTGFQVGLNDSYDLAVNTKTHYRLNDHFREMTYMDFAVSRDLTDWFNLGLAFRAAQNRKPSVDVMEYRPQLVPKLKFNLKKLIVSSTNRLEYRMFSQGDNYLRHYHNIFINFPSLTSWLDPYLGEGLFTKLNSEGLHLVRFYGGLHLLDNKSFKLDAYYVWQSLKSDDRWKESDILGLSLKFRI